MNCYNNRRSIHAIYGAVREAYPFFSQSSAALMARLSKPRVKKRAAYVSRTEICSQRFAMKAFTDQAALCTPLVSSCLVVTNHKIFLSDADDREKKGGYASPNGHLAVDYTPVR